MALQSRGITDNQEPIDFNPKGKKEKPSFFKKSKVETTVPSVSHQHRHRRHCCCLGLGWEEV